MLWCCCPPPGLLDVLLRLRPQENPPHSNPCLSCFHPACWLKENVPRKCFFLKINVQHSVKCQWTPDNLAWIFFGLSRLGPYLSSSGILLIALRAETLLGPCFSKYARTLDVISLQVKDGKAAIFYQNHWAEDLKTFVTTDWNTTRLILAI